jgi:hypothetical protein
MSRNTEMAVTGLADFLVTPISRAWFLKSVASPVFIRIACLVGWFCRPLLWGLPVHLAVHCVTGDGKVRPFGVVNAKNGPLHWSVVDLTSRAVLA